MPLAKTRAGYVGKQVQVAAFESLPTDVAISPAADDEAELWLSSSEHEAGKRLSSAAFGAGEEEP